MLHRMRHVLHSMLYSMRYDEKRKADKNRPRVDIGNASANDFIQTSDSIVGSIFIVDSRFGLHCVGYSCTSCMDMKKQSILTRGQQIVNINFRKENSMEYSSGPTNGNDASKKPTARRRLVFTDSSTDNDSKRKLLLDSLHCKMEIFKHQKIDLEKCGNLSAARRKRRRIQQYKEAIVKVDRGEDIKIDNLPDPEQPSTMNTNYQPPAEAPDTTKIPKLPGKKRNYCLYCEKLVKEYAVHIERHHADTEEGKALLSISEKNGRLRGQMKKKITDLLRKKANAIYNEKLLKEKGTMNEGVILVKSRHKNINPSEENTRQCLYCKGWYKKDRLSVHLKKCQQYLNRMKNSNSNSNLNSISTHLVKEHSLSIPMIREICGASQELKQEVLAHMNNDETMRNAIQDFLIMRFASEFHRSRRERIHWNYTASKIRDLTNLLIAVRKINPNIKNLDDCCNPANFNCVVEASLNLSGYDPETGTLQIPSMAYRLSHPLKIAVSVGMSDVLCKEYKNNTQDLRKYKMLKHFLQLIDKQWASKLGRIATRIRKEAQAGKVQKFALEEDIVKLCNYIMEKYRSLIKRLQNEVNKGFIYDEIMELVICHIMCLIRRRPVDFKRATLKHYRLLDRQDDLLEMVKGKSNDNESNSNLVSADLEKCKNFHIFYVPGKNLEIVPIVLTPLMKNVMDCLIKYRNFVGIQDEAGKLFVFSAMREVNPGVCLRKVKTNVKLKSPSTFTGNGLRHQAATFSRLHSKHPQYQDFLASALGHTLMVHKKHYDLPTSILQKLIVCPILYKMTMGNGRDAQPQEEAYTNNTNNDSHPNLETEELVERYHRHDRNNQSTEGLEHAKSMEKLLDDSDPEFVVEEHSLDGNNQSTESMEHDKSLPENADPDNEFNHLSKSESGSSKGLSSSDDEEEEKKCALKSKKFSKQRWTLHEQQLVFKRYQNNIATRILPPRSDVVSFYKSYKNQLHDRTVQSVCTYLHNLISRKQKNVSPLVKKVLEKSDL